MPENKRSWLIPAVGAALLVSGGVGVYIYFKTPSSDSSTPLGSAKLVPSTALMATYISTDPRAWAKLQDFGTPSTQKLIGQGLEDFQQDLFGESNISYKQDLQPWVAGVMVAMLPPDPTQGIQEQSEPNILMVLGIKDKLKALNFANKLKSQKGVKVQESDYKGEKITELTENGTNTYSAILNNNHVVLAPERQAVEQAIETFKGQPSFASKKNARTLLTANGNVRNVLAQVYVPDYAAMVQNLLAASPESDSLPPQTLKRLQQIKSMVASVGVDDQGVRMKAIANLDPQLNTLDYQTTPAKIVNQLPVDTFALVTGNSINRSWSAIVEQSEDYPEFKAVLQQLRGQLNFVNIDLDKDVFGWMDGEFALATIPSSQSVLPDVGVGAALLLTTSDRSTASATFSKLDNLAKIQQINVTTKNVDGKDITQWQIPGQGSLLSHGWLNQNTAFVAVGDTVAETIATNNSPKLHSSDTFKAVTGSLQKPNTGYFYLDAEKTTSLVNSFVSQFQTIPSEANTILSSIYGFGVTASSPNKSTAQLEMLLALKPKTAP
jgi:hypothetical protein